MSDDQNNPRLSAEFPEGWIETVSAPIASAVAKQIEAKLKTRTSPYLTVPEAAEYLRCKPYRIYQLASAGLLTRYKDGARVLLLREELDAYVSSMQSEALNRRRSPI